MMRKTFILSVSVLAIFLSGSRLEAKIVLPKVIGHNMVLQRHKDVAIWGSAAKGETVTVSFAGQQKQTVAAADGKWEVKLSPMEASEQPRDMVIAASDTIRLHNILVGEVWLCSGQSNMEYAMRKNSKLFDKVRGSHPATDDLQTANNPNIRIFLVRRKYMAPDSTHQGWDVAAGTPLRDFSAAGYFCAKELYAKLHVPVGMISSAVPGSRIEPWIEKKQLEVSPKLKDGTTLKPLTNDGGDAGKFYETMIRPVIPFTLSGVFWYQGESACFLNETIRYAYKFKTLVNSWRADWKDASLPFYFVQIAPYAYSAAKDVRPHTTENLPEFWESQALALKLPNTGMAVITDLVDSVADLHPGYKWEVGRRLALLALNKTYGMKDIVCNGPIYNGIKIVRDKIEVGFTNTGSGLASRDGKPLTWFSIAGADGKFYPADAVIRNNKVVVASPSVKHPVKVRFGWNEAAQSNFINKEGLPAAPFRSDNPWENVFE
ncbi:sialate O-acetylesterase [Paludibacter jiangxiensis]|nr:sialate O-acetylesterase [Paludibacter jiangxiensis]